MHLDKALCLHCLSRFTRNWVPAYVGGLSCNGLVSHPGESGVNDSLPLSTTETGDKHWPFVPSWYGEWFILTKFKNDKTDFLVWRLSYNCYLIRHVSTHVKWLWYHWEFKPNLFNFITEFCNFGPRQLIIIFHQS